MGVSKQQLLNTVRQLKEYIDYTAGPGEEFYTDFEINTGVDAILGTNGDGNNITLDSNTKMITYSLESISEEDSNNYVSNAHRINATESFSYERKTSIAEITNEREEI